MSCGRTNPLRENELDHSILFYPKERDLLSQITRWIVVGYGMGSHHAKEIRAVEELELLGVCDTEASRRAQVESEHSGIRTYRHIDEALADRECDGVVIVTPHNTHGPLAIQAMEAGKHVVTDKAICLSVEEARRMIEARDRAGVLLSTFHNRRWDSDFLTVRRIVEEGLAGGLYHIQSCVTEHGFPTGWRRDRRQMGGWLFDWGAHTIDQILLLAQSRPKSVFAFSHFMRPPQGDVEDYINCNIIFESGLTATTVVGYLNWIPMPRWYVMGDKATIQLDHFGSLARVKGSIGGVEGDMTVHQVKGDWGAFYRNIADVLNGRAELAVKPEELIPQIATAEAAYRSIAGGNAEPVLF